jgi:hypothetical protein
MYRVPACLSLALLALVACAPVDDTSALDADVDDTCAPQALVADVLDDGDTLVRAATEYTPGAKERRVVAAYWLVLIDSERADVADHALMTAGFEAFFSRLGSRYESLAGEACAPTEAASASPTVDGPIACEAGCEPPVEGLLASLIDGEETARARAGALVADPAIASATDQLHHRLGDAELAAWRGASSLDVLSDAVLDAEASEVLRRVGEVLLAGSTTGARTPDGMHPDDLARATAVIGGIVSAAALEASMHDLRSRYEACVADHAQRCASDDGAP